MGRGGSPAGSILFDRLVLAGQPAVLGRRYPPGVGSGSGVLGSVTALALVPFDRVRPLISVGQAHILLGLDQAAASTVSLDVDPTTDTLGLQGQFWYRGEYTFTAHPQGTKIVYRIKNVSGRSDAVIRLWQRRLLRRQQHDLDAFAAALPSSRLA